VTVVTDVVTDVTVVGEGASVVVGAAVVVGVTVLVTVDGSGGGGGAGELVGEGAWVWVTVDCVGGVALSDGAAEVDGAGAALLLDEVTAGVVDEEPALVKLTMA